MSTWLVIAVTFAYFGTALSEWASGKWWEGGLWLFYACANVCLMKATRLL